MKKKLVIGLAFFILFILFGSRVFLVKQIDCSTQFGSCSNEILNKLQVLQGISLFWPLPEELVKRQFKDQKQIKTVSLHRQFPRSINVDVTIRTPLGIANNYLIGSDGVILGVSTDVNLPLLNYPAGDLSSGLDQPGTKSLNILHQVSNLTKTTVSGLLDKKLLEISVPTGQKIILDIDKSDSDWPSSLQLILDRSKISLKLPKIIDLRFTQPIITY